MINIGFHTPYKRKFTGFAVEYIVKVSKIHLANVMKGGRNNAIY